MKRPVLRRYANIIAVGAVSILLVAGFIFYLYYSTHPSRKPTPQLPQKYTEKQLKWYIKFSVKKQKSTAYTEEAGAPLAANGKSYYIGGAAVHPRYPLQEGGKATVPLIPFGTVIHFKNPIKVQGRELKSMTIIDTGDVNYGLWPSYPYWFDIFWGSTNYYNDKGARDYGAHLIDYYWYEPWK